MVTLRMGDVKVSTEPPKETKEDLEFVKTFWITSGDTKVKMGEYRCSTTGKIIYKAI